MSIKVFVSGTSKDLKIFRKAATETLKGMKIEPIVQDHFAPDHQTVCEMLRDRLSPCDAVLCLVGHVYGAEPKERPEHERRRSYTQMEYDLAIAMKKPIYRFFLRGEPNADETKVKQQLQHRHRRLLMSTDQLYEEFSTVEELQERIAEIEFKKLLSRIHNLPYRSIGSLFKGREDFIRELRQRLSDDTHAAVIMARQAIHGLGGIGKTRLAVEYAWRHQPDYVATLFVVADDQESLDRNLSMLVRKDMLDLPEQAVTEQETQKQATLNWLSTNPGWLLIFDNVDTPEAAEAIEDLLPRLQNGHVLITSRQRNWGDGIDAMDLDVLDEASAIALLMEKTGGKRKVAESDDADAQELVRNLGCLALAIEQAGSYIARQRMVSLGEYLQRWRDQQSKVREWYDKRLMKYPASVATTWNVTMEMLSDAGRAMLNELCWLDAEPMPAGLFSSDDLDALTDLADYSMVKWDGDSLVVHRLVQDVTRARIPESERIACLERAVGRVNSFLPNTPSDVRSWPVWDPMQTHVMNVIEHANAVSLTSHTRLMVDLGLLYKTKAEYDTAEHLYRQALAIDEGVFGKDHSRVAIDLNNLASLLADTNRLEEAEPLMRRALAIDEQSFGTDHPKVAIRLNNLGQLLKATNRLEEAEPLMRRALAIDEQSFGTDHPKVAIRLNNLGQLLADTNRLEEAEPLMRRALEIDEQSFGTDHPNVARDLNNLGLLLKATNRLSEAELLMRQSVVIFLRSLGAEHPNTQTVFGNWTIMLKEMGLSDEEIQARVTQLLQEASSD